MPPAVKIPVTQEMQVVILGGKIPGEEIAVSQCSHLH